MLLFRRSLFGLWVGNIKIMSNIEKAHFSLVKGDSNHFRLSIIIVVAAFLAGMISVLVFDFGTDLELLQPNTGTSNKNASLDLNTPNPDITQGSVFPVEVLLQSGLPTTGVDVALQYDPEYLELTRHDNESPGSPLSYLDTTFSVFDIFPYADVKPAKDFSIFSFSALAKPLKKFKGSGVVASLDFKALKRGDTVITVISEPGGATDSNVAFAGKDILNHAGSLRVRIR